MPFKVITFVLLCAIALGASFLAPLPEQDVVAPAARRERPVPELTNSDASLARAADLLSDVLGVNRGAGPGASGEPELAAAELASRFRSQLSAIATENGELAVWLIDSAGAPGRRRLVKGDSYFEGWSVNEISPTQIVLEKADEVVIVPVFGSSP